MDEKRKASGQKLLDVAHEFWRACQEEGQHGAVQWLIGHDGSLVIFTRGEYKDVLMENIQSLRERNLTHRFKGEEMPGYGEDDE